MTENQKWKHPPHIVRKLKQFTESDLYHKRGPRNSNIVGARFGRLVIQRVVAMNTHGQPLVLVYCDCGGVDIKLHNDLEKGTKSCGCLAAERRGRVDMQVHKAMQRLMMKGFKDE